MRKEEGQMKAVTNTKINDTESRDQTICRDAQPITRIISHITTFDNIICAFIAEFMVVRNGKCNVLCRNQIKDCGLGN